MSRQLLNLVLLLSLISALPTATADEAPTSEQAPTEEDAQTSPDQAPEDAPTSEEPCQITDPICTASELVYFPCHNIGPYPPGTRIPTPVLSPTGFTYVFISRENGPCDEESGA